MLTVKVIFNAAFVFFSKVLLMNEFILNNIICFVFEVK